MKVLTLAPYITIDENSAFNRSRSGFGYMVRKIVCNLSELEEIDMHLLTQSSFTNAFDYGKLHICRRRPIDVFRYAKPCYLKNAIRTIRHSHFELWKNCLFYYLSAGQAERLIRREKPDLVHIHGVGYYTLGYMLACVRTGVPFGVTLHGLVSLDESAAVSAYSAKLEREFLIWADQNSIPVTVISTGMKQRIEEQILGHAASNITVITNGVEVSSLIDRSDFLKVHGLEAFRHVFCSVGNISGRKNQYMIIDALAAMTSEERKDFLVIFAGNDNAQKPLVAYAEEKGVSGNIHFCGAVPNEQIGEIYRVAHYNVLASASEGFGLSMAEAYAYGVPTLCFGDIDAVADLYDACAMYCPAERSAEALRDGMLHMTEQTWDRDAIRAFSDQFSLERMTERYAQWFRDMSKEPKCLDRKELEAWI